MPPRRSKAAYDPTIIRTLPFIDGVLSGLVVMDMPHQQLVLELKRRFVGTQFEGTLNEFLRQKPFTGPVFTPAFLHDALDVMSYARGIGSVVLDHPRLQALPLAPDEQTRLLLSVVITSNTPPNLAQLVPLSPAQARNLEDAQKNLQAVYRSLRKATSDQLNHFALSCLLWVYGVTHPTSTAPTPPYFEP